ncbi:integrin alpha-PS1 [Trichonephila inaurata madagascariensis]|uniref:Integrin alpha-PS1 n=1 Tax=Trichonephila inaurata madagascariensis TaxID=2747483 RepID=A0A8X6YLF5_9ARAC|nr:integrin alpha-PS1 [Trichonephila inaurata madagascariensis]
MKLSSTSNLRCMATSKWYLWLHWFRDASFWIEIKHRFFDVAFTPVFTDVSMHRPALLDIIGIIFVLSIKAPKNRVIKKDQWLDVTVQSGGPEGYVMFCVHRYILAGDDYQWGQSIYYSLKQDLSFGKEWEPNIWDDIGNEVVHIYKIINHGLWLVTGVEVFVSWSYETIGSYKHGKWLLYIVENPEVIGNDYCELDPSQLNPLKLQRHPEELRLASASSYCKRVKRGVEPQELRMEGKIVKVVNLDCEKGTAKCFQFDSRAHICAISDDIRQTDENNGYTFAETKAYPDIALYQKTEEVALWIIILAACAGILLLIILIIILWKRNKPGYEPAPMHKKRILVKSSWQKEGCVFFKQKYCLCN